MAHEVVTTTRYTCDRCGRVEEISGAAREWSKLQFQMKDGGTIGGRYTLDDVCPQCTENFERWMNNRDA